jgi:hypothetical protein
MEEKYPYKQKTLLAILLTQRCSKMVPNRRVFWSLRSFIVQKQLNTIADPF